MASSASGEFRAGEARGSGTEDFRSQAAFSPAENPGRRQAVVAYLAMKSVLVPAYAKVNLCLDIVGRRGDGYHELRTIFQTISLHDTLSLEVSQNARIDLRIVGNSALAGEPGRGNLVYRALDELRRELRLVSTARNPCFKRSSRRSSSSARSEEHTSELHSPDHLVSRLLL